MPHVRLAGRHGRFRLLTRTDEHLRDLACRKLANKFGVCCVDVALIVVLILQDVQKLDADRTATGVFLLDFSPNSTPAPGHGNEGKSHNPRRSAPHPQPLHPRPPGYLGRSWYSRLQRSGTANVCR